MKLPFARGDFPPARFWSRVDRSGGPDACWPWTGAKMDGRYGSVHWPVDGVARMVGAHRVALALNEGEPVRAAKGRYGRHLCHNEICCNPAHLTYGSQQENKADQIEAGRQPRGSAQNCAKLTEDDVRAMRRAVAGGEAIEELARRFGVRGTTAGKAIRRQTWKHVE